VVAGGLPAGINLTSSRWSCSREKTAIQRQIDATDRQIDLLVYELYGLKIFSQ